MPGPRGDLWSGHVAWSGDHGTTGVAPARWHAVLRPSVERGTPFGAEHWVKRTAAALGLESSLNPPGRSLKRARADSDAGGLFASQRP